MKKIIIGGSIIVVLGLAVFLIPKSSDWQTYENTRYEFSVSYPGNWDLGEAPTNNDGREFISPDGEISCHVYGFQNALTNDQGDPQTLDEFVDWLEVHLGYGIENYVVLERNDTIMLGEEAQELITSTDEIIARAVYILGEESGRGLACYYESERIMKRQNKNFEIMKDSFRTTALDDITSMSECTNLVNGVLTPLKDIQTFRDTKYTEVTITSRDSWDKDRLPKKVVSLENKNYVCYPMPAEFDYDKSEGNVVAEPAVTEVEWNCELEYNDWKYLDGGDDDGKQTAEKNGFTCKKETCFADVQMANDDYVWLCTK